MERTCLREGNQMCEDFLRDEHILGEMMHDLGQRGSKDNLVEMEMIRICVCIRLAENPYPRRFRRCLPH